jgi:hypothetical protein
MQHTTHLVHTTQLLCIMYLLLLSSAPKYLCDNDSLQYSLEQQTEMDLKEGGGV